MAASKPSALPLLPLILAAVLSAAVALSPSAAQADSGAIRALEMRQEVNFPDGVILTLTAQSDTDIVEVRVFFRADGSRSWAYAYADFAPGSRITATRSIPASESAYLAPGVDVEYYYQIRDANGAVLKTERATVEYLDDRFHWRRVHIGPLELLYHDLDDDRIADAARNLERDLQRVVDLLGHEPRDGFKGVIYNSKSEASAVFPVQSQTTTDHGTFAGFAFPEQGVFVGQELSRRIIVHESAHLLLREALGESAQDLPAWLDEGFASYTEPNTRIRSSGDLHDRTPPLRGMNRVSGTPETIPLFYYKAESVVAYLIEEYGEDNFRRLLNELRQGRTIEAALLNVYGFDVDGLDARWAGLPTAPAATPVPTPTATPAPTATAIVATATATVTATATATATVAPPPSPRPATPAGPTETGDEAAESSASASVPAAPVRTRENPPASAPTLAPAPPVQSQQRPDETSPFVFIDTWVLAGVALLSIAAVGFRFAYTRLRRHRRDPGDDAGDWDEGQG